jgi:membrane protease YdiL (CAAX protease family)
MTLSSTAWVHIFHRAARDVALNLVAEQVRAPHSGHASTSAVMLALWVTVAGPAAEELLDRGLLFNVAAQARRWVPSRYSPAVVLLAAILSSLFFALSHTGVHGDAANTIPDRFAMGMILCGVYWQTGSLLPAIAVHIAWNFDRFQVAALGSHPVILNAWPAVDVPILLAALAALVAVSAAAARRRTGIVSST